jgi:hypothetical protein
MTQQTQVRMDSDDCAPCVRVNREGRVLVAYPEEGWELACKGVAAVEYRPDWRARTRQAFAALREDIAERWSDGPYYRAERGASESERACLAFRFPTRGGSFGGVFGPYPADFSFVAGTINRVDVW